jgi:predicted GNAT family N-acyltransferase
MNQHIKITIDQKQGKIYDCEYVYNLSKVILALLIFTSSLLLTGCHSKKTETQKAEAVTSENLITLTPAQIKNANVTIGKLGQQQVSSVLTSVPNTVELSKFYVSPSQHGLGVAQKLMQRSFELVHELGWSALWLNVNQQNLRANRFYEKSGFAIVGECDFVLGSSVQKDFIRELTFASAI